MRLTTAKFNLFRVSLVVYDLNHKQQWLNSILLRSERLTVVQHLLNNNHGRLIGIHRQHAQGLKIQQPVLLPRLQQRTPGKLQHRPSKPLHRKSSNFADPRAQPLCDVILVENWVTGVQRVLRTHGDVS